MDAEKVKVERRDDDEGVDLALLKKPGCALDELLHGPRSLCRRDGPEADPLASIGVALDDVAVTQLVLAGIGHAASDQAVKLADGVLRQRDRVRLLVDPAQRIAIAAHFFLVAVAE